MTNEEYLRRRIKDLQKNVSDKSLPVEFRRNQAVALTNYTLELRKEIERKSL